MERMITSERTHSDQANKEIQTIQWTWSINVGRVFLLIDNAYLGIKPVSAKIFSMKKYM